MTEYMELGSTPCEEQCAQVGSDGYAARARAECRAFINQIRRMRPEPEGARLVTRSSPHDFGTYYEVAVRYDADNDRACAYAYALEGDSPETWDEEARKELGI